MRFINELSPLTVSLLSRIYKVSKKHHVRQRAHCILLSARGMTVAHLASTFSVTQRTIYTWMDRWEDSRFAGLYDQAGRGRKPKLNEEQHHQIKTWIRQWPKSLRTIMALIESGYGLRVSRRTLQRVLDSLEFSWRRIRKKPKGQPEAQEYAQKKESLAEYRHQAAQGELDLYYLDETGFCLEPYIPYAWQEKGQPIEVESSRSKRLNVLGFLSVQHGLTSYTTEARIDSEYVIACLDAFSQSLTRRTILVLDNSSFHTSDAIAAKIAEWRRCNLELFYLPKYSPQLNLIEILWRFMKYEWIEWWVYKSWSHLVAYVEQVICGYGKEYEINFV